MKLDVFITDFELISSLGCEKDIFWSRLAGGETGVSDIGDRVSNDFPVRQAAVIKEPGIFPDIRELRLRSEVEMSFDHLLERMNHGHFSSLNLDGFIWCSSQYGRKITDFSSDNLATYESFTNCELFKQHVLSRFGKRKISFSNPRAFINQTNACITGVTAIQSACKRIQSGEWTRALVFLHEARCREWILSPYLQLRLLSQKSKNGKVISTPFSPGRSGFIKGEGAVLILLESEKAVEERKGQPLASILGCSNLSDGKEITKMSENQGPALKMLDSLFSEAGIQKNEVNYINGYGSASQLNDKLESSLYKEFFGSQIREIPVTVGKPQFGHLNSAAVGMELVSTVLMMKKQKICPTLNYEAGDPECDLDYVPNLARDHQIHVALKMAFGFGWSNAAILLRNIN